MPPFQAGALCWLDEDIALHCWHWHCSILHCNTGTGTGVLHLWHWHQPKSLLSRGAIQLDLSWRAWSSQLHLRKHKIGKIGLKARALCFFACTFEKYTFSILIWVEPEPQLCIFQLQVFFSFSDLFHLCQTLSVISSGFHFDDRQYKLALLNLAFKCSATYLLDNTLAKERARFGLIDWLYCADRLAPKLVQPLFVLCLLPAVKRLCIDPPSCLNKARHSPWHLHSLLKTESSPNKQTGPLWICDNHPELNSISICLQISHLSSSPSSHQ